MLEIKGEEMKARRYKKLTKTAVRLLIQSGFAKKDEFDLYNNQWMLFVLNHNYEESWYDEIDPWKYLYSQSQETCLTWDCIEDDSELGYHVEEVLLRDIDLSTIEAIRIFKDAYIK